MNEVLQYGALGILGTIVIFVIPFVVKFLVDFIRELRQDQIDMVTSFKETIDNHLDHETIAMNTLVDTIERLCKMWEDGK
ncbi:MAG: hypothetical protein WC977_12100 [Anaerovoracaceae bacterium]